MVSKTGIIVSLENNFTIKSINQDFVAAHTSADGVLQLRLGFKEWSTEVMRPVDHKAFLLLL